MCSIAGKIYFDREIPVQESLIREMCDTIVHRGPDDSGVYADRHFCRNTLRSYRNLEHAKEK
jgi:asparagine synthetase B (glutamine-hydrolysing)